MFYEEEDNYGDDLIVDLSSDDEESKDSSGSDDSSDEEDEKAAEEERKAKEAEEKVKAAKKERERAIDYGAYMRSLKQKLKPTVPLRASISHGLTGNPASSLPLSNQQQPQPRGSRLPHPSSSPLKSEARATGGDRWTGGKGRGLISDILKRYSSEKENLVQAGNNSTYANAMHANMQVNTSTMNEQMHAPGKETAFDPTFASNPLHFSSPSLASSQFDLDAMRSSQSKREIQDEVQRGLLEFEQQITAHRHGWADMSASVPRVLASASASLPPSFFPGTQPNTSHPIPPLSSASSSSSLSSLSTTALAGKADTPSSSSSSSTADTTAHAQAHHAHGQSQTQLHLMLTQSRGTIENMIIEHMKTTQALNGKFTEQLAILGDKHAKDMNALKAQHYHEKQAIHQAREEERTVFHDQIHTLHQQIRTAQMAAQNAKLETRRASKSLQRYQRERTERLEQTKQMMALMEDKEVLMEQRMKSLLLENSRLSEELKTERKDNQGKEEERREIMEKSHKIELDFDDREEEFQNLKKRVVLQTALLREHALVQNRHNRNRGSTSDLQDRDANENAAGPTHNGSALGYNAHLYYEAGDAGVSFKRMAQELISAHLPPASAKRGGDKKDNRDNNDDIDDNNSNGNTADHDEHDNIDDNDDDDNGDNRTSSASYTPLQQDLLSLQSIISQQESYAHRQASHIHHTTTQIQELKSTLHSERRYTQRLRHLNDKQTQYLDQQSRGLRMSKEELVSLKVLEVKTHASLPFPLTCASSSTSSNARGKTQGYMLGGVSVQLAADSVNGDLLVRAGGGFVSIHTFIEKNNSKLLRMSKQRQQRNNNNVHAKDANRSSGKSRNKLRHRNDRNPFNGGHTNDNYPHFGNEHERNTNNHSSLLTRNPQDMNRHGNINMSMSMHRNMNMNQGQVNHDNNMYKNYNSNNNNSNNNNNNNNSNNNFDYNKNNSNNNSNNNFNYNNNNSNNFNNNTEREQNVMQADMRMQQQADILALKISRPSRICRSSSSPVRSSTLSALRTRTMKASDRRQSRSPSKSPTHIKGKVSLGKVQSARSGSGGSTRSISRSSSNSRLADSKEGLNDSVSSVHTHEDADSASKNTGDAAAVGNDEKADNSGGDGDDGHDVDMNQKKAIEHRDTSQGQRSHGETRGRWRRAGQASKFISRARLAARSRKTHQATSSPSASLQPSSTSPSSASSASATSKVAGARLNARDMSRRRHSLAVSSSSVSSFASSSASRRRASIAAKSIRE